MAHVCRHCKRTFSSELELELHLDTCESDTLFCDECGERFPERTATEDGWHYRCPTDGCSGSGIGDALHRVSEARLEVSEH